MQAGFVAILGIWKKNRLYSMIICLFCAMIPISFPYPCINQYFWWTGVRVLALGFLNLDSRIKFLNMRPGNTGDNVDYELPK